MINNKFHTKDHGCPKSAEAVAIATFAAIVNPALSLFTRNFFNVKDRPISFCFEKLCNSYGDDFFRRASTSGHFCCRQVKASTLPKTSSAH